MDQFVQATNQINSKNLHEFESRLASEVSLSKRVIAGRTQSNVHGDRGAPKTSGVNKRLNANMLSPG